MENSTIELCIFINVNEMKGSFLGNERLILREVLALVLGAVRAESPLSFAHW